MNDKLNILLKDVLNFKELKEKYPDKRIKLRFNTSWTDFNKNNERVYRDYLELYESDKKEDIEFFKDSILSIGSDKRSRLSEADIVFQFIEIQYHVWLLIDVINITNKYRSKKGYNNITEQEFDVAEGESLDCYKPFYNRLTVEWKNKPQQFFYVSDSIIDDVKVREILPNNYLEVDKEFVGYDEVSEMYKKLKIIIDKPSWKEALSNVYGVYVLTDTNTGKLYVGSATGEKGIYGRWKTYLDEGYDDDEVKNKEYPNKQLCQLVKDNGIEYIQKYFQYSILEIFTRNDIGKSKALEREKYWKEVLKTKKFGYNDN